MFSQMSTPTLAMVIPLLIAVYFLPAIIAVLLNRRHKGKIIAANVPAGFSWFLWFAVLAWAVTGKSLMEEEGS